MTSPGWRTELGTGEGLLSFGEMLLLAGAEGSGEEETKTSAGTRGLLAAAGGRNSLLGGVVAGSKAGVGGAAGGGGGGGAPHWRSETQHDTAMLALLENDLIMSGTLLV